MGENINIKPKKSPQIGDRVSFKSNLLSVIVGPEKEVFEGKIIAAEKMISDGENWFLVRVDEFEGYLHNGAAGGFSAYLLEEAAREPKNDLWVVYEGNILEII